jgi:peptidoglycan hydrolase-like protein with peptidoglycan-binding domain
MPFIPRSIRPGETLGVSPDTIRQLHDELAASGFSVPATETASAHFGSETEARVREFQSRHGLAVTGTVDDTTDGVLELTTLVTTEGDPAKLRTELKDAVDKVPNSPEYNYWLARYAIMAGDYATPETILKLHPDLSDLLGDLGGIFHHGPDRPWPQPPEVPYPENFYSYQQDLIDQAALAELRSQLDSITLETYAAALSTPGNTFTPQQLDGPTFTLAIRQARTAIAALSAWQDGNHYAANRELTLAMQSYRQCQASVADYCDADIGGLAGDTPLQRIQTYLNQRKQDDRYSAFWGVLHWRRILLSLGELSEADRVKTIGNDGAYSSASAFLTAFTYTPSADNIDPHSIFAHTDNNRLTRLDSLMDGYDLGSVGDGRSQ